jgi:hypothetical protein
MKSFLAIFVVLGLMSPPAHAQLSNDKMMKIVIRDTSPGLPDTAFICKPKTLYRMSHTYGRIEELADRKEGIHGLLVVAEPKAWMINLADSSGRMVVDPGPTYNFRASIAKADFKKQVQPLQDFEFGTEYDYLQSHRAKGGKEVINGKTYDKLSVDVDGYTIVLLSQKGKWQPFRVIITKGTDIDTQYDYDEYQIDLAPNLELFKPPSWVRIAGSGKH